ncbi:hypothetical protein [Lactobacillus sp. PSON]|uniref:hypothetical protein n=1 Tax=Lactobacillus sp. PSON TaxID=3455454 RepID=UPI004041B4B7
MSTKLIIAKVETIEFHAIIAEMIPIINKLKLVRSLVLQKFNIGKASNNIATSPKNT